MEDTEVISRRALDYIEGWYEAEKLLPGYWQE